jgi:hypothetical protein
MNEVRVNNEILHHKLAHLHQSLLHGKLPRNLHWSEGLDLIRHLGTVSPSGGDEFAFVVGTQREIFKRPRTSEFEVEDVSRLRRLLKAAAAESRPEEFVQPCRMVVVIDHHGARVFRDLDGTRPRHEGTIEPYDPHHFHHHLIHRKEAHYRGDRVPEESSFYEEVAEALRPAKQIVLIGHGTGKSSALDVLVEYLKAHRPDISGRVLATEIADLSALTEPEVEAIARRHMIRVV